jgi:tripartite-type tricarboxylate transporter receptor subunit TctC
MRTMIWRGLLGFAAPVLCALAAIAQSQVYPSRSITVVVPFPAGGPSDVVARS